MSEKRQGFAAEKKQALENILILLRIQCDKQIKKCNKKKGQHFDWIDQQEETDFIKFANEANELINSVLEAHKEYLGYHNSCQY